MHRDLDALTSHTFDLLVVGGGVHGLLAAWDAALRGLQVALVERHDFGGAASSHPLGTIGGRRFRWNPVRMRREARERRAWARIAGHLLTRQRFAAEAGHRSGLERVKLLLESRCTFDRNADVPEALTLGPAAVVDAWPAAASEASALAGGPFAVWDDYTVTEAERLAMGIAISAVRAGATLANYVDAIEPVREGRKVVGIRARDLVDGHQLSISARVLLNATGAAGGRLMAAFGVRKAPPLVKTLTLVTTRSAPSLAALAPTAQGLVLTAGNWQGRLAVGPWHGQTRCGADASLVAPDELAACLSDANDAFPALRLTESDLALVHRSVVPARGSAGGRLALADRPLLREHRQDGVDGAITLVGTLHADARLAAEAAVTLATAQLGRHAPPRTATYPLPGFDPTGSRPPVAGLDQECWDHLQRVYGNQAGRVASTIEDQPSLAERISPAHPVVGAQIVEAIRHEMAFTLEDLVLRRTSLGTAGYPGDEAVLRVETIARQELGWSSARVEDEVLGLKQYYLPVHVSG